MTGAKCIRALVIDDEPLAREMIREMLEGDPQVEIIAECGNGRAAVGLEGDRTKRTDRRSSPPPTA